MNDLLTIGTLSRQTGVHVKSLRYYGELGILPPAHTDPETGYRYYKPSQVAAVEAIQFCVMVGIPLARLRDIMKGEELLFSRLMDEGCAIAEAKIRDMRRKLSGIRRAREEMKRMESYRDAGGCVDFRLPARSYWLEPFEGVHRGAEFNAALNRIFRDIDKSGVAFGIEGGILRRRASGGWRRFIMVEVRPTRRQRKARAGNIVSLPAATYRCRQCRTSRIDDAHDLFPGLEPALLLETEVYYESSGLGASGFELRALLPD